jgi:hypothetical protein
MARSARGEILVKELPVIPEGHVVNTGDQEQIPILEQASLLREHMPGLEISATLGRQGLEKAVRKLQQNKG